MILILACADPSGLWSNVVETYTYDALARVIESHRTGDYARTTSYTYVGDTLRRATTTIDEARLLTEWTYTWDCP